MNTKYRKTTWKAQLAVLTMTWALVAGCGPTPTAAPEPTATQTIIPTVSPTETPLPPTATPEPTATPKATDTSGPESETISAEPVAKVTEEAVEYANNTEAYKATIYPIPLFSDDRVNLTIFVTNDWKSRGLPSSIGIRESCSVETLQKSLDLLMAKFSETGEQKGMHRVLSLDEIGADIDDDTTVYDFSKGDGKINVVVDVAAEEEEQLMFKSLGDKKELRLNYRVGSEELRVATAVYVDNTGVLYFHVRLYGDNAIDLLMSDAELNSLNLLSTAIFFDCCTREFN